MEELTLPKLKLKVEDAVHGYLTERGTDREFKASIRAILDEFEGKRLLHQNIGQLVWECEKENALRKNKFEKIWILLEQISPQIIDDFNRRMKKCRSGKHT